MQLRSRSTGRIARVACLVLMVTAASAGLAAAQEPPPEDAIDASTPEPRPAPSEPIDASKNGTIEAEIPASRESTTGVPDNEKLRSRLIQPRWDRGGFFIGLGGHYAIELTEQIGGTGELASGGGVSLRVGLKHNRWIQTEFTGVYTSRFKADDVNFFAWGVHLGQRLYLTRTRLQPYVGAHVGFTQVRGTNYSGGQFGFVPKFNTGLNFYTSQTFNWELDVAYYLGEIGGAEDTSFATATLGFNWF